MSALSVNRHFNQCKDIKQWIENIFSLYYKKCQFFYCLSKHRQLKIEIKVPLTDVLSIAW